jgi:anaphase-promoting complex subunit 10
VLETFVTLQLQDARQQSTRTQLNSQTTADMFARRAPAPPAHPAAPVPPAPLPPDFTSDDIEPEEEDPGRDEEEEEDEEVEETEEEEEEEEEADDASYSTDKNKLGSPSLNGLKEIGNLASWTVSTAKPGNGIDQLRDDDTSLFWQSDGPQPHHINIHFAKRVKVKRIRMFLDFENDESYTPTKMSILSGTGYHDLLEVTKLDLERPTGWVEVPLDDVHEDGELRTFLIQVAIHANHQNGKDTHVRGLQIFAAEPYVFPFRHNRRQAVTCECGL